MALLRFDHDPERLVERGLSGKLTADREGLQSYVIFIVRDKRKADFLFQCSDTTWQAYNRWPDHFALYDDGHDSWYWGPGVDVSFNRPYGKYCQILDAPLSTGSGEWFLWEFPMAYWMEAQGFDVTYISNMDTHTDGPGLLRANGFISIGHDEDYSIEMFNQLRSAIATGLNAGFLLRQRLLRPHRSTARLERRAQPHLLARRFYGPRDEAEVKRFPAMGKLPHTSPNSNLLVGAGNIRHDRRGRLDCNAPDHWLFAGTGMKLGDGIPGLVGWEWHGQPAAIPGLKWCAGSDPRRAGQTQRRSLHRDGLPRGRRAISYLTPQPAGGPRVGGAAWLHPPVGLHDPEGTGSARTADHF